MGMKLICVSLIFVSVHAHANGYGDTDSPCAQLVQKAKSKCESFVYRDAEKAATLDQIGEVKQRCGQHYKIKPGSEQDFEQICIENSKTVVEECKAMNSNGATGPAGASTLTEALNDLTGAIEHLRQMHQNRWKRIECPEQPTS